MLNWPEQSLYFAVIDGDDPRNWKPWASEGSTYGDMVDDCANRLSKRVVEEHEPKAHFRPLTDPIDVVLASGRLGGIVGAIIDGSAEPSDVATCEAKMAQLESLCLHVRHGSTGEDALIDKLAFEVWFFINGDLERWKRWDTRAKNIVFDVLGETPRVEWVVTGSAFPQLARRLLSDSRHSILYSRKR